MKLTLPELSLVLLIGPSGAGKSTFARHFFKPTEVISSDTCRGLVSDDENNQEVSRDAFEVLRFIATKRLAAGRLTVIDATNVQPEARRPFVQLAREFHVLPVALVLDVPEVTCQLRNRGRADRTFGPHVVRNQLSQLHRSLRGLEREGFRHVHVLKPEQLEELELERQPLWNNLRHDEGPFDLIGDVHGCLDELVELLEELGYRVAEDRLSAIPPPGRKAIFLGDLIDRGPYIPGVLRLVMNMVAAGAALCVPGNHEIKLLRKLRGKEVKVTHGLEQTLAQFEAEPPEFRAQVAAFIDDLVSHYVLDRGRLVAAHAGLKESMQGRGSGAVRSFALFGETTGETDEYGLPVRHNWASEYRGKAMVVYGHTPVAEPEWLNNTICIDTGCVYGGKLTALRYPERELISVEAARVYREPVKPLQPPVPEGLTAQQLDDDLLDLADVLGKRTLSTRLHRNVTVREENAAAALEVMSRFAIDPRWLIYLPPTMSPSETSTREGYLEHLSEAFDYYRGHGVTQLVCEEKHMGSRAVAVICRTPTVARERFGVVTGELGACFTRTGRRFFNDPVLESEFLEALRTAAEPLFDALGSDWLCLDCELMPWSLKALELVRDQYAAVGAAGSAALLEVQGALQAASARGLGVSGLNERNTRRRAQLERYRGAYRHYCWEVRSLAEVKLAPFHLLASEGAAHFDKDHLWHLRMLRLLRRGLVVETPHRVVALGDAAQEAAAVEWWEAHTRTGGEGAVVKPLEFAPRGKKGLIQPAIKSRGRDYLRIIYGPEYDAPDQLERLRGRGLSFKRSLALREFALGVEGVERFVRREPLRRVHECVFGVLALESEPVDPRL
jgi:protein phosphatase